MVAIDEHAAVAVKKTILIHAPAETVWNLMADIDRWPEWNSSVSRAHLEGELRPGTVFRWKAGPGTITSIIAEVAKPSMLAWTGRTMGIRAVHVWSMTERGGATEVVTEESWDGIPARLFRNSMRRTLETAMAAGLEALRRAAETRE